MSEEIKDNFIGVKLDNRYEIQEFIGEGGMAVVYKALDLRLDRSVAVKILRKELSSDEEFVHRFASESHAVAMLSHPNIVAVYDVSHSDEIEFIVMELIYGITLKQYLEKKGHVSWKEVMHFSKQIASGLAHAHKRGIIHRDVKPQNIMLLQDGTIKVADFGIAALENEFNENSGTAIGSLNYISPEQAKGMGPDARSDIYSLGVMMYELICGKKPYIASNPSEILAKQNGQIVPISEICPDVPEGLCKIIYKAMETNVNLRYQTASEMLEEIEKFTNEYLKSIGKIKEKESETDTSVSDKTGIKERNKEYLSYLKRSTKVSFGLGTFSLMFATVLVFTFLWNFWLEDIFSPAQRVELPNFVGLAYEDVSGNKEYNTYFNFKVENVVDTRVQSGTVLSQTPDAGRSLMITPKGIDVELKVSTGFILTEVPDLLNIDYREALLKLQNAGFNVEINMVETDSVDKDKVIAISPAPGEMITAGSTVYLNVSGGTQISFIKVPNVIGLSEDQAIQKITSRDFTYGGTEIVDSEFEAGTVIAQSLIPFSEAEERSAIVITISSGYYPEDNSDIIIEDVQNDYSQPETDQIEVIYPE